MSGKITLAQHEAEWLLNGALAAASKDDVTPVLCAVQWEVEGGRVTVTATDRYRVHQLHVKTESTASGSFLMSRRQAEALLKSWHLPRSRFPGQKVDLEWEDGDQAEAEGVRKLSYADARKLDRDPERILRIAGRLTFTTYVPHDPTGARITYTAAQVRGTFPPVARLFPTEAELKDGEPVSMLALDPTLLSGTRWLRSGYGSLRFVVPAARENVKAQPILVVNTEGTARALVQPVLMSHAEWKEYGT